MSYNITGYTGRKVVEKRKILLAEIPFFIIKILIFEAKLKTYAEKTVLPQNISFCGSLVLCVILLYYFTSTIQLAVFPL